MDFNSLREQVSNLTLYDLKAGVRKVQNGKQKEIRKYAPHADCYTSLAVMNYTEMEAKVNIPLYTVIVCSLGLAGSGSHQ